MNMAMPPNGAVGRPIDGPRTVGPAAGSGSSPIRISPSRQEVNRKEPSLVFHVVTHGLVSFDVIVATDRALFLPENAHQRTPKNFRSSRQDFDGHPIDAGTGFYILPTAFLRELAALPAMPDSLYFLAVGYHDAEGQSEGIFSTEPNRIPVETPHVVLSQSLRSANLSAVLGMAVDRLGVLANRGGGAGVLTARGLSQDDLPRAIGGLPVYDRRPGRTNYGIERPALDQAPVSAPTQPPQPDPQMPNGGAMEPAMPRPAQPAMAPEKDPVPTMKPGVDMAPGAEMAPPATKPPSGSYVDEDETYGAGGKGKNGGTAQPPVGGGAPMPSFYDDLDSGPATQPGAVAPEPAPLEDYDDGFDDGHNGSLNGGLNGAMPPASPAPSPNGGGLPPMDNDGPGAAPKAAAASYRARSFSDGGLSDTVTDKVIEAVAATESGGRYDAINPDGEFKGRFGRDNVYYNRAHVGLSFGLVQFTQDGGALGDLLTRMRAADEDAFLAALSPVQPSMINGVPLQAVVPSGDREQQKLAADALLTIVTATGPRSLDTETGRSARVQPVLGRDLWEEPWLSFFRYLGDIDAFNQIQRILARERYLDPIVEYARDLGLMTERGLAMLYDRSIQQGPAGGMRFVVDAVGPVDTTAKRTAMLEALGHEDLTAFQTARGIGADGEWGKRSHAAMVAAIRDLGAESPVEAPGYAQMLDQINAAASTQMFAARVAELRAAATLSDDPLE